MQFIEGISVVLVTYNPLRPFPGSTESHLEGWIKNVCRLKIATEIILVEMLDDMEKPILPNQLIQDSRIRVIHRLNDPPYADPVCSEMLQESHNDWVFFLADDERMSEGMITLLDSLSEQDPLPQREWGAIQFRREDYIFYNDLWRYIPANGDDPQVRLVDRRMTTWDIKPHTVPCVDGLVIYIQQPPTTILHYRAYEKIVKATENYNQEFSSMPHIVQMQTNYMERVKAMLGVISCL